MVIYIDDSYFDILEKMLKENIKDLLLNNVASNIKNIFNLLLTAKIKTKINNNEFRKLFKKGQDETEKDLSFREKILINAIKKNSDEMQVVNDYTNLSAFYFINEAENENILKKGIIVKFKNESFKSFYENASPSLNYFKGDYANLTHLTVPANCLLIVDPYIFGAPNKVKLANLILYIQHFKTSSLSIKFHLTIITSNDGKENLLNDAFNDLCNLGNIEVEIINSLSADGNNRDRRIYSNYFDCVIGHPFENKTTYLNQNFLAIEHDKEIIKRNYDNYALMLSNYRKIINTTPTKTGLLKNIWRTEPNFKNRIFDYLNY